MDFDINAANWRAGTGDQQHYLIALTMRLQSALPGIVDVRYGLSFKKIKPLKSLSIVLGDNTYMLNYDKSQGIQTRIGHSVRGVVLSTKEYPFPDWLNTLNTAIQQTADQNCTTSNVLEDFLL